MARVKQFDQEEVLEKAMNLFWKKGFHATSMQDLVDKLGINRASIYATFNNKNELFQKALALYQEQNSKRKAAFLYQYVNVRQGLYFLFESEVSNSLLGKSRTGCFLVNSIAELANADEKLNQIMDQYKAGFEQVYFNYLQYGVNQGQVSPYKDIRAISNYLFTLYSGIKLISKIQNSKEELMKIANIGLTVLD